MVRLLLTMLALFSGLAAGTAPVAAAPARAQVSAPAAAIQAAPAAPIAGLHPVGGFAAARATALPLALAARTTFVGSDRALI